MSEIKILTTPFSINNDPKELLYHEVMNRLLNSKHLRKIKSCVLDYLDSKLSISDLDNDLKKEFDGYEINMFYHGLFSSKGKINSKKINLLKEKFPNIYAVHGNYELPIGSYSSHRLNFARELDKEKTKLLIANLDCANELMKDNKCGFKPIVFHAGFGEQTKGLENVIKNVEFALDYVDKKNYKLAVLLENLPKDNDLYLTTDVDELAYVKNIISSYLDTYNFGFCFDFGHANCSGFVETKDNSNFKRQHEIIDELGHYIKYAHVNYNECHKLNYEKNFENIKKYKHNSDMDWHNVFPLDDENENNEIKKVLEKLNKNTLVGTNGLINLEVFPKHYFANSRGLRVEAFPYGYEDKNKVIQNIKFLKDSFK